MERREQLVVNKDFQQRFVVGMIFSVVLLINLVILFDLLSGSSMLVGELSELQFLIIGLAELFIVGIVYFLGIRLSHQVAGPVYVVSNSLEKMGDGDLSFKVRLRKRDFFREVEGDFNDNVEKLRERIVALKTIAQKLEGSLGEGQQDAQELVGELKTKLDELKTE
ncbi:hypothetical protein BOW53_14715 [Solemya pervernicosa gill symbiont]|uniref:HAMP domain-containing protein n=2 Tax=Gammaproteobacteria incertae sedis TaxID=118884 RepID=A0A1T2L0Q4_9GAMM|nr:methyl-accepting chemotaxis protein [Candidatus Reidiella endopervernicosa]OOZ38644.1 hypothetical protein BOW53_14715 [Solemya pervernicosa gill symbiont]QKQ26009.1 methyl-accepting chemotaxis protein [Candidatus Reidiella endopervernicosa]